MEVEETHQENNQLDDQMFSTMAPNVGPLHVWTRGENQGTIQVIGLQ